MLINRGKKNTTVGTRTLIYCEGDINSSDILFYKNILGKDKKRFKLRAIRDEFENLEQKYLPGKEIFRELKSRIFNNTPRESDIIKDIALLMEADGFIPPELETIFG